jgi:hypothetical protein
MTTYPRMRTWLVAVVLPFALLAVACGDAGDGDLLDGTDGEVEGAATHAPAAVLDPDHTDAADAADAAEPAGPAEEAGADAGAVEPVGAQRQILTGPPDNDCSASGHRVTLAPAPDLPEEVAVLRVFLIDAALRCDEQLLQTAIDESDAFNASFGGDEDALGLWWSLEAAGEEPFLRIAEVLATTPGLVEGGDGPIHVWPRVSAGGPEDTTGAAWSEVTWVEDVAAARAQGDGYLDWRAGISDDGQWRYFVRGD